MQQAGASKHSDRRGVPPTAPSGKVRRGVALALALAASLALLLAAAWAADPDPAPLLRFAPRPNVEAVRCIGSLLTRTETVFWGATNRGDAPVAGPLTIELTRIHPDGTQTLLKRETAERLGAGQSVLYQYMYDVVFCVTTDPRLPWPGGGRFRVTLESGAWRRAVDALDP